jgi:N-methylhydantoinase B
VTADGRPSKDPITVEVIHNYLLATAREMNRNLVRTAYSTIVYENHDFGIDIYDRHARLLAEAPGLALFTRGNDYGLKKIIEYLGEENIHDGDLILLNYPYWSSHHILDVLAVSPIFVGDHLIGYTAAKMHWLDLGQKDAGYVVDSTSIFQEGLVLPCAKIYKRGELNRDLVDIIRFNSRLPDRVIGDMNAQIASCRTGERRVRELVEKFGVEQFETAVEEILDHGERLSRARLAALPKGTWTAEDYVDDDGIDTDRLVKIKVTVTVTDDEMFITYEGSDPATAGPVNLPIGCAIGSAAIAFKAVTTPETPANEGNFRPLRVEAPAGSVMHAEPPVSTFTLWSGILATEIVTKALAQGLPEEIPACSGGDVFTTIGVGTDPATGGLWVESINEGVGFGGHSRGDGENGIMHVVEPGARNTPIEVVETKAPIRIESYALRQDSGGPGRFRGGLGIERTWKFLTDSQALTIMKKTKTRPWGMHGGQDGENGYAVLWPGTPAEEHTGTAHVPMAAGDRLIDYTGGGGGWGNPLERDPQHVLADVRNEYVSAESARDDYGVVIDLDAMEVDEAATMALRKQLSNAAPSTPEGRPNFTTA